MELKEAMDQWKRNPLGGYTPQKKKRSCSRSVSGGAGKGRRRPAANNRSKAEKVGQLYRGKIGSGEKMLGEDRGLELGGRVIYQASTAVLYRHALELSKISLRAILCVRSLQYL